RDWARGEVAYATKDSTRATGLWSLSVWTPAPGVYEVSILTSDNNGLEVKDIQFIEIYDPNSNRLTRSQYLWAKGGNAVVPGETTTISIGSSASEIFLIKQLDRKAPHKDNGQFIPLSNEKKTFTFGATEADRGGYGAAFFFVKDNRFYSFEEVIAVPWSNKEISVEFATFREKTLPGTNEKWTVTVRGTKGEKLAAEMLVSMYDASLDAFQPHQWLKPDLYPEYSQLHEGQTGMNFTSVLSDQKEQTTDYKQIEKVYDQLLVDIAGGRPTIFRSMNDGTPGNVTKTISRQRGKSLPSETRTEINYAVQDSGLQEVVGDRSIVTKPPISVRRNFNETAFFFPHLLTDKNGDITFSFTTPEALTRWKLQTLAHTKELAFGSAQKELITQKELMVQPTAPRFLRQGDRVEFTAKIVNLSAKEVTGQAEFQLVDASTNQSVDGWFLNSFPNQYFTVAPGGSEVVKFPMEVPYQFTGALLWRVIARAGTFSDGEEMTLPLLTNKVLVTETIPLTVKSPGVKKFSFPALSNSNSPTLVHHALTVEYTTNPAWYAVQALPFLLENVEENAEAVWNRFYANALAGRVVSASPRIRQLFATWKTFDTATLFSNLQKNEELKSALLRETPWVLQAKSEEAQKKQIALLFDLVKRQEELLNNLEKLKQWQSGNGAFSWMKGAPDDRYMTQYILTGLARLRKLHALPQALELQVSGMEKKALQYLEAKITEDYTLLIRKKVNLKANHLQPLHIQYLYLISLNNATPSRGATIAVDYYRKQALQFWTVQSNYLQGLIALALQRRDQPASTAIIKSLKETAIRDAELGMYWKSTNTSDRLFWHKAPIETQALLIEVFTEIDKDQKTVDALKTWLLLNKQTNNWQTSKATADACYALLLQGTNWLTAEPAVEIKLGATTINSNDQKVEAGTGYFKKTIATALIKPAMGNITVTHEKGSVQTGMPLQAQPSWGAIYWQYFEEADKVLRGGKP
ncbi:MAG: alpha-2-macroglobulin family protein, partial [Chitinophagaceae bacterium]